MQSDGRVPPKTKIMKLSATRSCQHQIKQNESQRVESQASITLFRIGVIVLGVFFNRFTSFQFFTQLFYTFHVLDWLNKKNYESWPDILTRRICYHRFIQCQKVFLIKNFSFPKFFCFYGHTRILYCQYRRVQVQSVTHLMYQFLCN